MKNLFSTIIKAGLIVGTLDILAAFAYNFMKSGVSPSNILRYVASGVLGNAAFSGGNIAIFSGLLFHYIIAFAFTIFFFWLFPKLNLSAKNTLLTGILYGIFIWVIMNLVVVPFSNVPKQPFNAVNAAMNAVILIVCIGIPLSFMANRFYNKNTGVSGVTHKAARQTGH